jgi:hypothetical protein
MRKRTAGSVIASWLSTLTAAGVLNAVSWAEPIAAPNLEAGAPLNAVSEPDAAPFPFRPTGRLNPAAVNVLAAADADRTGEFMLKAPVTHLKQEVIGWQSAGQALHWTVIAPQSDDYAVTVLLGATSAAPLMLTVSTESSATSTQYHVDPRGGESRSVLDRPLYLEAGRHTVTLAMKPAIQDAPFDAKVLSVELTRPAVRFALHREALAERSDVRWMGNERLGLAFTWSKRTMPRMGPQQRYADAVAAFPVDRFADEVASTGATFVVFGTAHSDQYIPGPNVALDAILPGRTAQRDLIADLIAALGKRHIRLFLYYHLGPIEDPAWSRATHMWDSDPSRFFRNWIAIVSDMGRRYGAGLAGWWFDDGLFNYYYRSPDWAELDRAAKTGNPGRAVCFNSWNGASATEFQDYYCGEETVPGGLNDALNHDGSFNGLLRQDGDGRFNRGQFAGLQSAAMFALEGEWVHTRRDAAAAAPRRSAAALATTLEALHRYRVAPMVSLLIYQDGTIPPASLATVREAAKRADIPQPATASPADQ